MAPKNTSDLRRRSNLSGRADPGSGPTKGNVPATASQTDHVPQVMSSPLDGRFSRGNADYSGGVTQARGSTANRMVPPKAAQGRRGSEYPEQTRSEAAARGTDVRLSRGNP